MDRQTRVILLVEDSEDDADLTARAFRNSGADCKLVLARDGKQALDYIFARDAWAGRDTAVAPLLILLALKLTCSSGFDVLYQLRQSREGQYIPIVVMSCSTEASDIATSYRLGANSYIRKPVDFVEFAEAVALISRYWLSLNQPSLVKGDRG